MALMLRVNKLLAMAKDSGGLHIIIVGKVFLWLISHSIILQLWRPFHEHLSPHQFGVSTPGGCEAILFSIWAILDLHPDWAMMQVDVENVFNKVSWTTIFKKLCDARGLLANIVPFTRLFHGAHLKKKLQHGWHVERVTIIESSASTKQGP
jgi:hypothetical protein